MVPGLAVVEALAHLASCGPCLVLVDIELPEVNGLELVRRLRANPAFVDLVCIAFTAHAMAGDTERMLAAGCDGYISKPVEVMTFVTQVKSYLRAHEHGT